MVSREFIRLFSRVRFGFLAVLAAALLLCAPPEARAIGVGQQFNQAYEAFHALRKDDKRNRYRSEWEKVERGFSAVLKRDPDGAYAPKSLYYQGRVYEEMGAISVLKSDFQKAVDYFHRTEKRFRGHDWADDCLFRAAIIQRDRLGNSAGAYADFLRIVKEYPKSDMQGRAKQALNEIDNKAVAAKKAAAKPASKPAPKAAASKPAPKPEPAPESQDEELGLEPDPDYKPSPPTADGLARLDMIRYRSSDDYTRVVLELNKPIEYVYKFLNPLPEQGKGHRVYIDLRGARIGDDVKRSVQISDGILRGYRAGQNDKDVTRVVFDLLEFQDHKVFHLDNPFRIIVDVYSPGNGPSATAQAAAPATKPGKSASGKKPPSSAVNHARGTDPGDLIKVLGLTVKTVMIDAGHGGYDKGAVHNGMYEKTVNLQVAKLVGELLVKKGFKVVYTRTDDTFVALEERTAMANMAKADLFISLHCNAFKKTDVRGLETYSLSLKSSSAQARRVAARENGVQPHQISDLQFILADLVLNSKVEESSDLAEDIQRTVVKHVGEKYGIRNHGHRHAPFYVLMGAKMPSVLVELGYLTNKDDAANLRSEKYRKRLAEGIVEGVLAYKKRIEGFAMN
ncbi:MAG: N-acetylmuramoyl-L-alanine amidase [Desulfovibrionaceae bacterium]